MWFKNAVRWLKVRIVGVWQKIWHRSKIKAEKEILESEPFTAVMINNIALDIKENVISAYNRLVYTYDDVIGEDEIITLDAPWTVFLSRSKADLLVWLLKSGKCKSLSEEEITELTMLIETEIKTTPLTTEVCGV